MEKIEKAGFISRIKSRFMKLDKVERASGVETYTFNRSRYRDGSFLIVDMKSGEQALLERKVTRWNSHDCGATFNYLFHRYVTPPFIA